MADIKKTLYHGELREKGPTPVAVLSDILESTKKKGTYYIKIKVDNAERYYHFENQACLDFWVGKKGQAFTVLAAGSREEATLEVVADGQQAAPPTSAAAPGPKPGAAAPAPGGAPAPRPPATQAAPQSQGAQGQSAPARKPPITANMHPASVGACMNKAVDIMVGLGVDPTSPDFYRLCHEIASDLLRVTHMLESGDLAPSAKERAAKKAGGQ